MSSDLTVAEKGGHLDRAPFIDTIDQRRLALIKAKVSGGRNVVPTHSELAAFLELAARYDLDPFANEVWLAKSAGRDGGQGQLLIMVGRDGLRKIARRNGLEIDSDVVREKDRFVVVRTPERERRVKHEYMGATEEARGPIVGAWCEVWDAKTGKAMGYNYAPLSEYMPTNERKRQFSPWGSQVSVMIVTAAERNALRMATPLGGLLTPGEMPGQSPEADAEGLRDFIMGLDAPVEVREALVGQIERLNAVSPNAWSVARAQMALPGRTVSELENEISHISDAADEAERRNDARGNPEDPTKLPAWECAHCGQTNAGWAVTCGSCERAKGTAPGAVADADATAVVEADVVDDGEPLPGAEGDDEIEF